MSISTPASFDIRDHLTQLEVVKETSSEWHCICPICSDDNLKINKKTGAYQCWSTECPPKTIREAIAPWQEKVAPALTPHQPRKRRTKAAAPAASPISLDLIALTLVRLPHSPTDRPLPQKDFHPRHGEVTKTTYPYSFTADQQLNQWVIRTEWTDSSHPKGHDKSFSQWHRGADGQPVPKKGSIPWNPYRIDEAIALIKGIATPSVLLLVEGEACVEAVRQIGLAAITLQGSAWGNEDLKLLVNRLRAECPQTVLCIFRDNDLAGLNKASKVQAACELLGIFSIILDPTSLYPDLPDKGDVVDLLNVMDVPDFIRRLEEEIHRAVAERQQVYAARQAEPVTVPTYAPSANQVFVQTAFETLYSDKPWVCINDVLYYWTGTYYRSSSDVLEKKRIAEYCNTYAVAEKTADGTPSWSYKYANPSWVNKVLEWAKQRCGVDPKTVNPPGINCKNGVLQLQWQGSTPTWRLIEHTSEIIYTYNPLTVYDPKADSAQCDRMLEALDPPQREIFLKTIAASLDLATVRRHKGRLVRALLLKGDGNNGKDTLREAVSALYGYQGVTTCTFSDFKQYDEGRKFPLAKLASSRVNWASENRDFIALDKLQSLKIVITGDPIDIEVKGRDEYSVAPNTVFLFNVNDTPDMQASLEAIQSRYGILLFNKTFKMNADPTKGEIEADPRFKYDPEFLREQVLPAFLNRILDALARLMRDGMNYDCTRPALEMVQCESSHLWQFAKDVQLDYSPSQKLYVNEIWKRLETWYIYNGTLEIQVDGKGKEKRIWHEQARASDRNVKAANQVMQRFLNLFPKAKRGGKDEQGAYLLGLGFIPDAVAEMADAPDAIASAADAVADAVSLDLSDPDPTDAVSTHVERSKQERSGLKESVESDRSKATGEGSSKIASGASEVEPASIVASAIASELRQTASGVPQTASGASGASAPPTILANALLDPTELQTVLDMIQAMNTAEELQPLRSLTPAQKQQVWDALPPDLRGRLRLLD